MLGQNDTTDPTDGQKFGSSDRIPIPVTRWLYLLSHGLVSLSDRAGCFQVADDPQGRGHVFITGRAT